MGSRTRKMSKIRVEERALVSELTNINYDDLDIGLTDVEMAKIEVSVPKLMSITREMYKQLRKTSLDHCCPFCGEVIDIDIEEDFVLRNLGEEYEIWHPVCLYLHFRVLHKAVKACSK